MSHVGPRWRSARTLLTSSPRSETLPQSANQYPSAGSQQDDQRGWLGNRRGEMALQCPQVRERLLAGKARGETSLERAIRLGDDPEVGCRPECLRQLTAGDLHVQIEHIGAAQ